MSQILKEKHVLITFEGSSSFIKDKVKNITNQFWREVVHTWGMFIEKGLHSLTTDETIPNTVIWGSNLIKNHNILSRKYYFISRGFIYLKDVFDYENKLYKDRHTLMNQYNINITQYDYMCLLHSIPLRIKDLFVTIFQIIIITGTIMEL